MIIGLSPIQVGLLHRGGAACRHERQHLWRTEKPVTGRVVPAIIILLNRQRNPYLRVASLVIAMAAGYLLPGLWACCLRITRRSAGHPDGADPAVLCVWALTEPVNTAADAGLMITSLRPSETSPPPSDVRAKPVSGPFAVHETPAAAYCQRWPELICFSSI